jgi:hypothetical protein
MFHPAHWPHWLQMFLWITHGLLGFFMTWLWWPKTDKQWKRFGILAVYLLLAYYFVLRKFTL